MAGISSPPGDLISNEALPVLLSSLTYGGCAVMDGVTTVVRPRLDQGEDMYEDESDVRLKTIETVHWALAIKLPKF
jgi:hypothetical protein